MLKQPQPAPEVADDDGPSHAPWPPQTAPPNDALTAHANSHRVPYRPNAHSHVPSPLSPSRHRPSPLLAPQSSAHCDAQLAPNQPSAHDAHAVPLLSAAAQPASHAQPLALHAPCPEHTAFVVGCRGQSTSHAPPAVPASHAHVPSPLRPSRHDPRPLHSSPPLAFAYSAALLLHAAHPAPKKPGAHAVHSCASLALRAQPASHTQTPVPLAPSSHAPCPPHAVELRGHRCVHAAPQYDASQSPHSGAAQNPCVAFAAQLHVPSPLRLSAHVPCPWHAVHAPPGHSLAHSAPK